VALAICEDGTAEHCVITRDADPGLVDAVVDRLTARGSDGGLRFSFADDATWLREVFAAGGFSPEPNTGCEWEFDLDALPPSSPVAAGFVVEPSRTEDGHDHAGITRCLQRAFGSDTDLRPVLRSLESNPWYRTELSVVTRAPDGRIAAYCRGTADPDTGVCGIDPVATDPDFQRRGLGRAVLRHCFEAQRAVGGHRCYIGSAPEPAPGALLYRSLGPSKLTVFSTWSRPAP
jgi:ribosomal protein S18 acetylase RimI-like enzyme